MMSEQEIDERVHAVHCAAVGFEQKTIMCRYAAAVRLCQQHQFTAAAEGLLEAAERMVGIERGEKE